MSAGIQLYSVFHKPFFIPSAEYVIPIHAGKAISDVKLDMTGDDTGDNISALNGSYCELTVLYWIWKNAQRNTSHWGLSHYRRYFMKGAWYNAIRKKKMKSFIASQENIDQVLSDRLHEKQLKLLQSHDVIVQQPMYIHRNKKGTFNLRQHYEMDHISGDWQMLMQTITDLYPAYKKSIPAFNDSLKMSFFNMMIAPWNVWDDYLQWLFDVLFEVEKRITLSADAYQARVFGFMSERLLNLFIRHNKLKSAYLPIAVFDK